MISASDIKLLESERMSDATDGGGRRTSRVIPDGVSGNVFPKVSRLDAVYGRVNLRKLYGAVQTTNVDSYAGAHVIITDAPDNDKIHTTLFSTGNEFDTRVSARDRVESYVTSSSESRMTLIGRQLVGQQSILCYQRVEEPLPEVGQVFCLSAEAGSTVTAQQYIRVTDISHEVRTYSEAGDFTRRVITLAFGQPLRYEFTGPETPQRNSAVTRPSKVRETTVVDAARYYGIKKLSAAALAGDLDVTVQSLFSPVVPTTNRETPISNGHIGTSVNMVRGTQALTTFSISSGGWSSGQDRYTPRGIFPGSLIISAPGTTDAVDNGTGVVSSVSFTGTIDYETGKITRTGGNVTASGYVATYLPAAMAMQPSHTREVFVKAHNRGTVYAVPLGVLPSAGSVIVDFRALGKWYRLRDNGNGQLSGAELAYGSGSVNYATGSVVVTLGALPDVGSSVIFSFGGDERYVVRSGSLSTMIPTFKQILTIQELPVAPGTVIVRYTTGGVAHTATDDSAGNISGVGVTGTVDYATGRVSLDYSALPDSSSVAVAEYKQELPLVPTEPVGVASTFIVSENINLGPNVKSGSVNMILQLRGTALHAQFTATVTVKDNGSGLLLASAETLINSSTVNYRIGQIPHNAALGTINYTTGQITFVGTIEGSGVALVTRGEEAQSYMGGSGNYGWRVYVSASTIHTAWESTVITLVPNPGSTAAIAWRNSAAVTLSGVRSIIRSVAYGTGPNSGVGAGAGQGGTEVAALVLKVLGSAGEDLIPNSILFTMGGRTFFDRNGVLYSDPSSSSGVGPVAGSVNYVTNEVTFSTWVNGLTVNPVMVACAAKYGDTATTALQFRTPGAPLRPGSLFVQVTAADGTLLSGSSDDSGLITGNQISGEVDQASGTVSLVFGQIVTAAGNESEPWYFAAAVIGGQIFKPTEVMPDTFSYNCVTLANLPLNADILGMDPVRLPMDGRVALYKPADVVVIHNTGSFTLPHPATNNNPYSVGRGTLSELWLVDSAGVRVPSGSYTSDLGVGTVTLHVGFTLGALIPPLVAKHRIEDMTLVTDVQINGQLTLGSALSRDYPLDSFVSSALLFGDMNARATNVHDLSAFGAWTDVPGTGANAQYNNIDYPVQVLNDGSVTERWRLNFLTTTTFQVIGENLGVIEVSPGSYTGSTSSACSPTNKLTGKPYFAIDAAGWGSGWSAGNQLRFNTVSAAAPIWVARTILPGASLLGDSFSMQMRGDVDVTI